MIYIIESDNGPMKIGYSSNPKDRLTALQTANPSQLRLIRTFDGDYGDESALHRHFATKRIRGEWFRLQPDDLVFVDEMFARLDKPIQLDIDAAPTWIVCDKTTHQSLAERGIEGVLVQTELSAQTVSRRVQGHHIIIAMDIREARSRAMIRAIVPGLVHDYLHRNAFDQVSWFYSLEHGPDQSVAGALKGCDDPLQHLRPAARTELVAALPTLDRATRLEFLQEVWLGARWCDVLEGMEGDHFDMTVDNWCQSVGREHDVGGIESWARRAEPPRNLPMEGDRTWEIVTDGLDWTHEFSDGSTLPAGEQSCSDASDCSIAAAVIGAWSRAGILRGVRNGNWLEYKRGYWTAIPAATVEHSIRDWRGHVCDDGTIIRMGRSKCDGVMTCLRDVLGHPTDSFWKLPGIRPGCSFGNQSVRMLDGSLSLEPHDPVYRLGMGFPGDWGDDTDESPWMDVLRAWLLPSLERFPDGAAIQGHPGKTWSSAVREGEFERKRLALMSWIGDVILGKNPRRVLALCGPGAGRIVQAIQELWPDTASAAVSIQPTPDSREASPLIGALINVVPSQPGTRFSLSTAGKATAIRRRALYAHIPHRGLVSFQPVAGHIVACDAWPHDDRFVQAIRACSDDAPDELPHDTRSAFVRECIRAAERWGDGETPWTSRPSADEPRPRGIRDERPDGLVGMFLAAHPAGDRPIYIDAARDLFRDWCVCKDIQAPMTKSEFREGIRERRAPRRGAKGYRYLIARTAR